MEGNKVDDIFNKIGNLNLKEISSLINKIKDAYSIGSGDYVTISGDKDNKQEEKKKEKFSIYIKASDKARAMEQMGIAKLIKEQLSSKFKEEVTLLNAADKLKGSDPIFKGLEEDKAKDIVSLFKEKGAIVSLVNENK